MANELERLLVRFEADTAALRSALKDMDSKVDSSERNVNAKLGRIEGRFKQMGAGVGSQLTSLAAAFAGMASLGALNNLVADTAKLQVTAETVGMTAEKYQKLSDAARVAGVAQNEFDAAMLRFTSSVSEARQMTGGFYEFLRGQAPQLLKQVQGAKDTAAALDAVADAVQSMASAEDRALIVKQAFGDGALRLVKALESGRIGLNEAGGAADKFSRVASEQAVKAVKELDTELGKLTNSLKTSFVEAVGAAGDGFVNKFLKSLNQGIDKAGGIGAAFVAAWKNLLPGSEAAGASSGDAYLEGLEKSQKSGWAKVEQVALGNWQTTINKMKLQTDPRKLFPGADAITQLRISAAEASGRDLEAVTMQYDQELEKFKRMLDDKIISEKQFGEARALLGETMQSKIASVYEKETQMVRELADEFKSGLGSAVNSVFDSIIQGSFSASNAIRSLISEIAKMSMNRAVTAPLMDYLFGRSGSSGAATGFLNSTFGSGSGLGEFFSSFAPRAHGGPMSAGIPYIAGERGPELIVPNTAAQAMSGWQGGGGGSSVVYNIDARNADPGVEHRIIAAIAKAERERPSPLATARTFSQRFPTRR